MAPMTAALAVEERAAPSRARTLPPVEPPPRAPRDLARLRPLGIVAVLLLAAALRLWALATVPQGLFHDEAYDIIDEASITWRHLPVFFPANTGREALFLYWQKWFLVGLGVSVFSARLASATVGIVTVALQYAVVGRLFTRRAGVLSASVLATLQWHVQFSRISFRAVLLPVFVLLIVLALWRAGAARSVVAFAVAGAVAGLGANTYAAGFVLPCLIAGYALYLVSSRPALWRVWAGGTLAAACVFAAVIAPLALYVHADPTGLVRLSQTTALPATAGALADGAALVRNAAAYAGSFSVRGDTNAEWAVNIPGDPVFDPPMAALFYAGMLYLIWAAVRRAAPADRSRRDAAVLSVLTAAVMYLPGLLSQGAPYYPRTVGVLPVITLAPALCAEWMLRRPAGRLARVLVASVVAIVFLDQVANTARDYFVRWARSPQVAASFATGATEIAAYLRQARPTGAIYVSMKNQPTLQALAAAESAAARWFDPTEILPFPTDAKRDAYYFFDLSQPSLLEGYVSDLGEPVLDAGDRNAGVDVARGYRLAAGTSPSMPAGDQTAFGASVSVTPVSVGPDPDEPGSIAVVLGLRALRPSPGYLSLSVRAVDGAGQVWAQQDGLGDDLTTWVAGQEALTLHRLHVYRGTPPGPLAVRVQVYDLAARRPLTRDDGQGTDLVAGAITVPPGGFDDPVAPWLPGLLPFSGAQPAGPLRVLRRGVSSATPRQGDPLQVSLAWQCVGPMPAGGAVDVVLRDPQGTATSLAPPDNGLRPSLGACRPREPTLERVGLTVPPRWTPGPSTLSLVLRDDTGTPVERVPLGTVDIRALPRTMTAPPLALPVGADFEDGIQLLGLAAAAITDASRLDVRLVWRATTPPVGAYTVFAHVLDGDGNLVAQHDGPPAGGAWPTMWWIPGEVVDDAHEIPLPSADLPAGATLEVGLYDASGRRVAIASPGIGRARDGALRLPLDPARLRSL